MDKVTAVVCDDDDLFGLNYVHETVIEAIYILPTDSAYYSIITLYEHSIKVNKIGSL